MQKVNVIVNVIVDVDIVYNKAGRATQRIHIDGPGLSVSTRSLIAKGGAAYRAKRFYSKIRMVVFSSGEHTTLVFKFSNTKASKCHTEL